MRAVVCLALTIAAVAGAAAQSGSGGKTPTKAEVTEATTDHLRIRYLNRLTSDADGSVALTLEIAPRPGMHVYAPGADDYQIITMAIEEQRGIVPRPLSYPPSEIYHFVPLNERIPVYQKPFKLTLGARVESAAGVKAGTGSSVKVSGRLDYQACDDKVCFAPVSVPLSWTVLR